MGLFKSKDERRVEREMGIRRGIRSIEKSITEQQKFSEMFIKQAQQAKKIGDEQQYAFIRSSLKKTASIKRMLERQLVAINSALIMSKQANATAQFAGAMGLMSKEIASVFGELDLTKTQVQWENAMKQSSAMEERMGLFLDTMEQTGAQASGTEAAQAGVTDAEIDRMIEADVLAAETAELGKLGALESEIEKELMKTKQQG
jgi:hypothetical protein